jgi:hypothetical protein
MKILTTILFSLSLICTPLTAAADKGGNKGPSDRAYERASDNASFKRGDDYDKPRQGKQHKGDDDDAEHHRHRDDRDSDRDRDYRGSRDPNREREQDRERDRDRDKADRE